MPLTNDRPTVSQSQDSPPDVFPLRFLAFRSGGEWHIECLDLSLMTARPSFNEAWRELFQQIQLYLEVASESGQWAEYVPRSAPRSRWALYYAAIVAQNVMRAVRLLRVPWSTYRMPIDSHGHVVGVS